MENYLNFIFLLKKYSKEKNIAVQLKQLGILYSKNFPEMMGLYLTILEEPDFVSAFVLCANSNRAIMEAKLLTFPMLQTKTILTSCWGHFFRHARQCICTDCNNM